MRGCGVGQGIFFFFVLFCFLFVWFFVFFFFVLFFLKNLFWLFLDSHLPFFIPLHNSGRVLWFHVGCPSVCLSVRPSVFCFQMITLVNINGFSPNLVCALIFWRSGLGLVMGKFRQFLMELSARDTPIFSFRTITWVHNKGFSPNLLNALTLRRSRKIFTALSAQDTPIFSFPDDNLNK